MAQVGRISGALLTANLERQGKNLAFRDTLGTTELLYLDVNTGKIAVNNSTPGVEAEIIGTTQSTNLITDSLSSPINNLSIQNNTITATGDISLNASKAIRLGTLDNGSIRINDNTIRTVDSDANIDLIPQGNATTEIFNNLNIYGNLDTPGNITFGGTLTLGDQDSDDVTFNSDVNSDIIPDQTNAYSLGTEEKSWNTLYSGLINGQQITSNAAEVGGINVVLRPGGLLYVAQNGDDSLAGDHPQGALASISEALSRSQASGDQPVTILVMPGTYQEQLPLVVPEFVTVAGTDIRNVIITPDNSSQSKDVFHLNDKSVISNLTIKDFYYDSVNNTGYAFRFAPNAVMSDRSPYIQNVTVLTKGTPSLDWAEIATTLLGIAVGAISSGAIYDFFTSTNSVSGDQQGDLTGNGTITPGDGTAAVYINNDRANAETLYPGQAAHWNEMEVALRAEYNADPTSFESLFDTSDAGRFESGDAGRGAWIDGDELNSASPRATMLFHSCTFISPGADVINMTNGVRVEWLNSFTYFANRGLYAFNGTEGRTSIDGSTTIYGAELRSIGSANVYGTYGAVADGADCLMYLIQHNFAYIGAGSDSTNDLDLVVQANEVVETNSGQIHYVSTDQVGNFRVGDNFFVNFETGDTSLTIDTADIDTLSGLVINSPGGTTTVDGGFLTTGDILIQDNTISTNIGDLKLKGGNGTINLNNNTTVSGSVDIRDNFTFDGTLNIAGDQPGRDTAADTLVFNVEFEQDFNPHQNITHTLGEVQRPWLETFLDKLIVDDIDIDGNVITTNLSSADLELRASGTGNVVFSSAEITNDLETFSLTNIQDLNITETLTHVGDYNQTGNRDIAGNLNVTGSLDVTQKVQLEEILIDDNFISTTTTDENLELRVSGTGVVFVPNNNVEITSNLSADNLTTTDINVANQTEFNTADVDDITIQQNFITTHNSSENLELRASNAGIVNVQGGLDLTNDLEVVGTTLLQNGTTTYEYGPELVINGTYDTNLNGWAQTGGGFATATGGNLRIDATGAARNVSQEITVEAGKTYDFEAQFRFADNSNTFYLRIFESGVGTLQEWNNTSGLTPGELLTYSFVPQTNTIDIIFRSVDNIVEWDNVSMFEDIGFVTTFTPVQVNINTSLDITGNTTQTGNINQTGNSVLDTLTISNDLIGSHITIDSNKIKNTSEGLRSSGEYTDPLSIPPIVQAIIGGSTAADYPNQVDKNLVNFLIDNDLVDVNRSGSTTTTDYIAYLQYFANGTTNNAVWDTFIKNAVDDIVKQEFNNQGYFNSILFAGDYRDPNLVLKASQDGNVTTSNIVNVANNLFAAEITSGDINISQDLNLNEIIIKDNIIEIDDNFISTTISDENLELRATTGNTVKSKEDLRINQNLNVNGTTSLTGTSINGSLVQVGNRNQLGNLAIIGNITATTSNIESEVQFDDILINDNVIESVDSNANLELTANASGKLIIPTNDFEVNQNLNIGSLTTGNINIGAQLALDEINLSSDIKIFDNVITTTNSDSNLELRKINPAKNTLVEQFIFNNDSVSTTSAPIDFKADNVTINSTSAIKLPAGTTAENQNTSNSLRFNSDLNVFEGHNNTNVYFNGVYSTNRATSITAHPTNNVINIITPGTISGEVNSSELQINGLQVDDIFVDNNTIQTTVSDSNLDLKSTGKLELDDITITSNLIQNNSGAALSIKNTLYGRTKFVGPAVKIPSGTTAEQPSFTPETGMTRWNTENDVLEVWDGSTFITAAGTSASISQSEMDDLILEYTLIFG